METKNIQVSSGEIIAAVEGIFDEYSIMSYIDTLSDVTAFYRAGLRESGLTGDVESDLALLRRLSRHLVLLNGLLTHYSPSTTSPKPVKKASIPATANDEQVLVDKYVFGEYRELASLVNEFIGNKHSPIWSLNYVLQHWLTTTANLQEGSSHIEFLESMLATVTFIYDISRSRETLSFYEQEAREKEVNREK